VQNKGKNQSGSAFPEERFTQLNFLILHLIGLSEILTSLELKSGDMIFSRKTGVAVILSLVIIGGIAATKPPEEHKFKNLKILPKNISMEDLDKVMDHFKEALGVKCNFCHAASKDSSNHHLDFASDEKPEKNIARKMYKMTVKINKNISTTTRTKKVSKSPPWNA